MKTQTESHFLSDILFYVEAFPSLHHVNFVIYEASAIEGDSPVFGSRFSKKPASCDRLAKASIKWDGCSNLDFSPYYHGCNKNDLEKIGKVLAWCWDKAGELMPETWDPQ